ncbi:MAG: peptidylprolyl isomerase, partial [Deltaproteobacteria bacterium]|nr:peptidylprolyl isomerase [Deltaproteobacteria bacterium]
MPPTHEPALARTTLSSAGGQVGTAPVAAKMRRPMLLIASAAVAVALVVLVIVMSKSSPSVAPVDQPPDATGLVEVEPTPSDAVLVDASFVVDASVFTGVDLDSKDILARMAVAPSVHVKHVLIGWADLADVYRGRLDPRAAKRSNADAAKLAREVRAKLESFPGSLDAVIKEHSEDPGSSSGTPYQITEETPFVPAFKQLGLRLAQHEVGIVRTQFGYHVVKRVPDPPRDAIESVEILARSKQTEYAEVQHILIGWKGSSTPDPRSQTRDKAAAETLAKELLAKVRTGGNMATLMKEYSEDPGSKDSGDPYSVSDDGRM